MTGKFQVMFLKKQRFSAKFEQRQNPILINADAPRFDRETSASGIKASLDRMIQTILP